MGGLNFFSSKNRIINKILSIEQKWFSSLKTNDTRCKEDINKFLKMRKINFVTWSIDTLKLYLKHIQQAETEGRNLMAEKYLIMSGDLDLPEPSPLIKKIVDIELGWLEELRRKYPYLLKEDSDHFKKYLTSELKTYSKEVIQSYYHDLKKALKTKRNLTEEKYREMAHLLGYNSIEEMLSSTKKHP